MTGLVVGHDQADNAIRVDGPDLRAEEFEIGVGLVDGVQVLPVEVFDELKGDDIPLGRRLVQYPHGVLPGYNLRGLPRSPFHGISCILPLLAALNGTAGDFTLNPPIDASAARRMVSELNSQVIGENVRNRRTFSGFTGLFPLRPDRIRAPPPINPGVTFIKSLINPLVTDTQGNTIILAHPLL